MLVVQSAFLERWQGFIYGIGYLSGFDITATQPDNEVSYCRLDTAPVEG